MSPCVLLVSSSPAAAAAGGRAHAPPGAAARALPAAPISAGTLGLTGRIVDRQRLGGQGDRPAAARRGRPLRDNGEGVALVSDAGDLEREVRAPRGEGALRFLRRDGPAWSCARAAATASR